MKSSNTTSYGKTATSQREIHIKDLAQVVLRHWKIVLIFPALVAGGAWLSSRNAIPSYRSHLTVQISSPKQVFARLDDIDVDEFALRTDPILSEALVLTTQSLALRVVEALELQLEMVDPTAQRGLIMIRIDVDDDAPLSGSRERYELTRRQSGWEIRDDLGNLVAWGNYEERAQGPGFSFSVRFDPAIGEEQTDQFMIVDPRAAASVVTGGISYSVREATTAVDIGFTGTDPTLVPQILNQAAQQLRDMGMERARVSAENRVDYVQRQLAQADSSHSAKLRELQRFREREQVTDLSAEEAAVVDRIATAEQERQDLIAYRETLQDALSAGDDIGIETLNRLSAVPGVASNSSLTFQINQLLELHSQRSELTAGELGLSTESPQVQALDQRIARASQSLQAAVEATLQSSSARIEALASRIEELRGELAEFPGKATQVAQIQLEVEILNQNLQYLLGQQEIARMQEATIAPYIQLLDSASPPAKIGTSKNQKIVLGLLVGILLGLGAAFFLEYLDQTIKTSEDIERILSLPVLGTIPEDKTLLSKDDRRAGISVLDSLDPEDRRAEAYRSLRTNVTFVGAERALQFLAVTSPGPGEGKSTTAANLASTLALGGNRTLLIDGDLRRPLIHLAFALVQEPGLTDILVGQAKIKEAIRPAVSENLDLLPAGPTPPNPSELLGSDAMHGLITELRRDYDYIIIDTPPTLPVTDAAVVASYADAAVLVLRSASTEEQAALRAVDQLRRVHARVAGVVLNGLPQKHDRYYYNYDEYRRTPPGVGRRLDKATASRVASL